MNIYDPQAWAPPVYVRQVKMEPPEPPQAQSPKVFPERQSFQTLGREVRARREANGLSLEALSALCLIPVELLRELEAGSWWPETKQGGRLWEALQ